ncbi:MAG: LCP family protein, partial [Actinomycetia bacterium]|nr:LCP family protein [Actinomycetes bacterium]
MGRHSANNKKKTASSLAGSTSNEVPERLRIELDARRKKRRRIVMTVLIALSVILAAIVSAGALWVNSLSNRMTMYDSEGNEIKISATARKANEPYTVLILGYDQDEWDTSRSDTIMLARIDEQLGKVWLVSIPRDLLVDIPGYGEDKINSAFMIGGPGLTVRTVEDLTDIPIHYYIGLELYGFVDVVDAMGGIEVDVPMDIEPGDEEWEQPISAGPQLLHGYEALWFVRTRYQFEDSDLTRVQNQQLFLKAVADQASQTPITRLLSVVSAVSDMVETNMSLVELGRMTRVLQSIGSENIYTATIPIAIEDPYLVVLEPDFTEFLRKLNAGEPLGEKKTVDESDDGEEEVPLYYLEDPDVTDISVDVRNGSDRSGLA